MLGSSCKSRISPNQGSTMDVDYGCYSDGYRSKTNFKRNHFYSPAKTVTNPYSTYSENSFGDTLQIILNNLKQSSWWLLIGVAFFASSSTYYQRQSKWVLDELHLKSFDYLVTSYQNLQSDALLREVSDYKIQRLKKETMKLQKETQELKSKYETKANNDSNKRKKDGERIVAKEQAWKDQAHLLQKATRREARRSVLDKFGEDPYYVEFTFILPHDEDEVERNFIVETAPLDLMPHAVHLFLEQVSHRLWDGTWFYLNGMHVLQAGPMIDEDEYEHMSEEEWEEFDDRKVALEPFTKKNLDTLAFPEYSEKFAHGAWTLGFAGRPGGPDWYINKSNNTEAHGPGGQHHHDLQEQADSCFAKVVRGFDQIELIFKEPTTEAGDEWEYFLEEPTYIAEARIISEEQFLKPRESMGNDTQHNLLDHTHLHHKMHRIHIDNQVVP